MRTVPRVLLAMTTLASLASASLARANGPDDATPPAKAALERLLHDPAAASDPELVDELAREVEGFALDSDRVQARMMVAQAWLHRFHRPDDALAVLGEVVRDPQADPLTRSFAEREIVETLMTSGKSDQAVAEAHAHRALFDARFIRQVERLARREWILRLALGMLAAFVSLAIAALVRARRLGLVANATRAMAALAPVAFVFIAFVALGGGLLAARYEAGNARPFLLLGAVTWPLLLLARAWGAVGSLKPAARAGRAALCGATLVAAAFVLLDVVSPDYLEGFGL